MRSQHLTRIADDFKSQLDSIVDDVEASTLKAKALELRTKHQKQQRDDVPLRDRFFWTDRGVANAFVSAYGGRVTDKHATIPWRLLYCRNGAFVAYVKEYTIPEAGK